MSQSTASLPLPRLSFKKSLQQLLGILSTPLLALVTAFILGAGVIWVTTGSFNNVLQAYDGLFRGAFLKERGLSETLLATSPYIFLSLAVAVGFKTGLFNIGVEGQFDVGAIVGAFVGGAFTGLPAIIHLPLTLVCAALGGAIWAAIPGYLKARTGAHEVITTIMMNFIAGALLTYLLVDVLIAPGGGAPESRALATSSLLPHIHDLAASMGIEMAHSPLNAAVLIAIAAAALVEIFIWHTRWGFALRTVGQNPQAALYAGISPARMTMIAMGLSGALAGLVGANEILGEQHRLILGFSGGYGFVGIAVALMGRNRPAGVVIAALLFGALYQGGSELALDMPGITRELVVMVQGLIILFCGAMEHIFRQPLERLFQRPSAGAI